MGRNITLLIAALIVIFASCQKSDPASLNTGSPNNSNNGLAGDNVFFYHQDQTGTLDAKTVYSFSPTQTLIKIKIGDSTTRSISGIWGSGIMPRCPVSTDYLAEPETIASFRLLPGEYKWSAESIPANLSMLPLMSDSSIRFWLTPRKDSGKLYVKQGETCLLQSIIF